MADTKEYKDLFKQTGTRKRLLVSFPNLSVTLRDEDIVEESMEISESLCSESELRFGSCEASVFKLRIIGNVIPLIGATCVVSLYVGDIADPYVLGTYKVASDKPTADRRYRDIVAYDAMYDIINADVSGWYNSILPTKDSATTLGAFRASFISHFGLDQEAITLPNDDMIVTKTIEPEELSGSMVMKAIGEINGCFGHIGRNGKMQYITLPEIESGLLPANDLFPMDGLFPYDGNTEKIKEHHYISCQYEDFTTKHISKLQIRQEENDIGCIVGNGDNCYIVENNFLVYGMDASGLTAVAQKLFDIISVVCYRPATAKAVGNPCLEVGAAIRLNTQHEVVETYILDRTLKGIQGLIDTYDANGVEAYAEKVNSVNRSILQIKGKMNILTRTVDETRSQLIDIEKDLSSQILQTAEEISAEVKRAQEAEASLSVRADEISLSVSDLENNLSSQITQTAEEIRLEISDLSGDLHSEITQLADEIELRVTAGQVSSMISVAVNGITLSASQISLEGYTTINGGFSIDQYGNVELRSANGIETVNMTSDGLRIMSSNVQYTLIKGGKISMFTPILSSHVHVASIGSTGYLTIGDGNATLNGMYVSCYNITCSQINGEAPVTRAEFEALAERLTAGGL